MSCASTAITAQLTAEEASAALVAMLGGRALTSIDEIREVAARLRARRRRSADSLITDIKAVGQEIIQAVAGDGTVARGPGLTRRWNALCKEVWSRPARTPQDAVAYAHVALFHTLIAEPERIWQQADTPFVKLVLAVLELEEVHHA